RRVVEVYAAHLLDLLAAGGDRVFDHHVRGVRPLYVQLRDDHVARMQVARQSLGAPHGVAVVVVNDEAQVLARDLHAAALRGRGLVGRGEVERGGEIDDAGAVFDDAYLRVVRDLFVFAADDELRVAHVGGSDLARQDLFVVEIDLDRVVRRQLLTRLQIIGQAIDGERRLLGRNPVRAILAIGDEPARSLRRHAALRIHLRERF